MKKAEVLALLAEELDEADEDYTVCVHSEYDNEGKEEVTVNIAHEEDE